jgi:prevent-host-death family protein
MSIIRKGAEEARNQLPELLDAAESGRATIITRHGRPVAVLAPLGDLVANDAQASLLALEGSGHGLWGKDSAKGLDAQRDEWTR